MGHEVGALRSGIAEIADREKRAFQALPHPDLELLLPEKLPHHLGYLLCLFTGRKESLNAKAILTILAEYALHLLHYALLPRRQTCDHSHET
jgi:hypothetical protein